MNPINLALRFILELITLISVGMWSWHLTDSIWKYGLAILIPSLLMSLWVIFAVPNDPSRSGKTVIPVPGIIRLILEFAFFLCGVFALDKIGYSYFAIAFGVAVLIHYLFSLERVQMLIRHSKSNPQF